MLRTSQFKWYSYPTSSIYTTEPRVSPATVVLRPPPFGGKPSSWFSNKKIHHLYNIYNVSNSNKNQCEVLNKAIFLMSLKNTVIPTYGNIISTVSIIYNDGQRLVKICHYIQNYKNITTFIWYYIHINYIKTDICDFIPEVSIILLVINRAEFRVVVAPWPI